jgi:hypothetical protein
VQVAALAFVAGDAMACIEFKAGGNLHGAIIAGAMRAGGCYDEPLT